MLLIFRCFQGELEVNVMAKKNALVGMSKGLSGLAVSGAKYTHAVADKYSRKKR
jgi:hypothetical protein